jgi:uncharacterized protein
LIFLDANVPMYLMGAPHRHKHEAQAQLDQLVAGQRRLVTDVEVLQEILHRYTALQRRDAIPPAIQLTLSLVDEIFPIEARDVLRAAEITQLPARYSGRDALHLAVMERRGVREIFSFDADFDGWPGLRRLGSVD